MQPPRITDHACERFLQRVKRIEGPYDPETMSWARGVMRAIYHQYQHRSVTVPEDGTKFTYVLATDAATRTDFWFVLRGRLVLTVLDDFDDLRYLKQVLLAATS
jgi:hypothetical protein